MWRIHMEHGNQVIYGIRKSRWCGSKGITHAPNTGSRKQVKTPW